MTRLICGTLCLILVAGCGDGGLIDLRPRRTDSGQAGLERIQSAADWLAYFQDQLRAQRERQHRPEDIFLNLDLGPVDFAAPMLADEAAQPAPGGDSSRAAPPDDFTGTNVQVAGVDEADIVKTDGRYLYLAAGNELRILEVHPVERMSADGVVVLELEEAGWGVNELYLYGDRVVAVHQVSTPVALPRPLPVEPMIEPLRIEALSIAPVFSSKTAVSLIDVSDRTRPSVTARWEFDGNAVSSRMIDGTLHLILTQYPYIPFELEPEALTVEDIEPFIPKYRRVEEGVEAAGGELIKFEDFYRPIDPDGMGMTTVVSLDVTQDKQQFESVAVMADPGTVFASTEALYLSDPDYDYYNAYRETLDIHKFSLRGGRASYVASGKVEGRLLNQFSLGEYQGHLCVATTTGTPWAWDENTSKNHVFVLSEAEGEVLEVAGSVEDLAPGERIYAARFVGDKGFLVTFRQVDPLFTIDLSDPSKPQLMGELKVPGFSEYIHILDEEHLLTLGRAATSEGRALGLQLSIFDVSDLAAPKLVVAHEIGTSGTSSEAEWNHKAFTFYRRENLLALPVNLYQQFPGRDWGEFVFSGLLVYHVTPEDGFTLRGQVSTAEDNEFGYPSYHGWTRGLFIEDHLYAVTEIGVKAATIEAPGEIIAEVEMAAPDFPGDVSFIDDIAILEVDPMPPPE